MIAQKTSPRARVRQTDSGAAIFVFAAVIDGPKGFEARPEAGDVSILAAVSQNPTKASRSSRFVSLANVVISQLNTASVTAGSFLVTPAVLYALGDSAYGGWLLINSFIGYTRLLDLGLSAGTVKYGAGAQSRGDDQDLARVMNTSAAMFFAIAGFTVLVTVGLAAILPRVYVNAIPDTSETIFILGAAAALDLGFRTFSSALRMRSLYFVYDGLELGSYAIFKLALVLYYAHQKRLDYHLLALLTFGETAARLALVTIASLVLNPASRRINPFRAQRSMLGKLATMGAAVSIIQIADVVRFQLDAGVIGTLLPESPEGIAIFGVGMRLPSIAYFAVGVIGSVLMPRFSGMAETEDKKGADELLRRSNLMTGLVSTLVFVNVAVLGPQFLALWLRKPWVHQSGWILMMMVPAYHIASLTQPSISLIVGRGKLRSLTILTVVEALVNLIMSVALIRPLGLYGVALGSAVPLAFFRGVVFPLLLKAEAGIAPAAYFRQHATANVVAAIYVFLVGGLSFVSFSSYRTFALAAAGSAAVFLVIALVFVPESREILLKRFSRRGKGAHDKLKSEQRKSTPSFPDV